MLTAEALALNKGSPVLHVITLNASAKDMALAGPPRCHACLCISPLAPSFSVASDETFRGPPQLCLSHAQPLMPKRESALPSPISRWYHPACHVLVRSPTGITLPSMSGRSCLHTHLQSSPSPHTKCLTRVSLPFVQANAVSPTPRDSVHNLPR